MINTITDLDPTESILNEILTGKILKSAHVMRIADNLDDTVTSVYALLCKNSTIRFDFKDPSTFEYKSIEITPRVEAFRDLDLDLDTSSLRDSILDRMFSDCVEQLKEKGYFAHRVNEEVLS